MSVEMIRETVKGFGIGEVLGTLSVVRARIDELEKEDKEAKAAEPPRPRPKLPTGEWPKVDDLLELTFGGLIAARKEIAGLPPEDPDRKLFIHSYMEGERWSCLRAADGERAALIASAASRFDADSFGWSDYREELWEVPLELPPAQQALLDFCFEQADKENETCYEALLFILPRLGGIQHSGDRRRRGFMRTEEAEEYAEDLGEHYPAFRGLRFTEPLRKYGDQPASA